MLHKHRVLKYLLIHRLFYLKFVKNFISSFISKKFLVKKVESSPLKQQHVKHCDNDASLLYC